MKDYFGLPFPMLVVGWPILLAEKLPGPKIVRFTAMFVLLIPWFPIGALLYLPAFLVWAVAEMWSLTD